MRHRGRWVLLNTLASAALQANTARGSGDASSTIILLYTATSSQRAARQTSRVPRPASRRIVKERDRHRASQRCCAQRVEPPGGASGAMPLHCRQAVCTGAHSVCKRLMQLPTRSGKLRLMRFAWTST
jgi:hypothetical protein